MASKEIYYPGFVLGSALHRITIEFAIIHIGKVHFRVQDCFLCNHLFPHGFPVFSMFSGAPNHHGLHTDTDSSLAKRVKLHPGFQLGSGFCSPLHSDQKTNTHILGEEWKSNIGFIICTR